MKVKVIVFYGFNSKNFSSELQVGYHNSAFRTLHFSSGDSEHRNRKINRKIMSDCEDPEAAINCYRKSFCKNLADKHKHPP